MVRIEVMFHKVHKYWSDSCLEFGDTTDIRKRKSRADQIFKSWIHSQLVAGTDAKPAAIGGAQLIPTLLQQPGLYQMHNIVEG